MGYQPYQYKASPTWVNGHHRVNKEIPDKIQYASQLEARMAVLLIRMGISFTPHVKFVCWSRDNPPKSFTYEIDFILKKAIKPIGASAPVTGIEVKGRLKHHDFLRCDSLRYFHGIRTLIVGDDLLRMYEEQGMFPVKEEE